MSQAPRTAAISLAQARDVWLLRAVEEPGETPLWTAEDRRWATRLARQTQGATALPGEVDAARYLSSRARHALQRLGPRLPLLATPAMSAADSSDAVGAAGADGLAGAREWGWRWSWCAAAAAAGLLAGLVVDHIGSSQQINLLAPPVWALLLWNLMLGLWFLGLLLRRLWRRAPASARPRSSLPPAAPTPPAHLGLRALMQRWMTARATGLASPSGKTQGLVLRRFAADWARLTAPLTAQRVALLMHVAAAAVALGLLAGMYLRGLVLDYRAGWQSSFLAPATVQQVLQLLLAPASAASGVAMPPVVGLQVMPGALASGPAAPWLHLYAMTLLLFVAVPRSLLAAAAALQARRLLAASWLPLDEPYFQQLLREADGRGARVCVWPCGVAPGPAATLALRDALSRSLGDDLQLQFQPPSDVHAEATAAGFSTAGGSATGSPNTIPGAASDPTATLHVACFDMASTPQTELHGLWLQRQRRSAGTAAWQLAVDADAFAARFVAAPERLLQRQALWREFAAAQGLPLFFFPT